MPTERKFKKTALTRLNNLFLCKKWNLLLEFRVNCKKIKFLVELCDFYLFYLRQCVFYEQIFPILCVSTFCAYWRVEFLFLFRDIVSSFGNTSISFHFFYDCVGDVPGQV